MDKFYINNSSLPYLTCARKYYLTVGKGLRLPPGGNKYTGIGLAFHELMQEAKVGESTAIKGLAMIPPREGSFLASITSTARGQVAQLAQKILDEHPEMFGPDVIREGWFDIPLEDFGSQRAVPHLCGTRDNLLYEKTENVAILTDWKSTAKPLNAELEASYQLTFQRWFYIISLYLDDTLPDNIKAAVKENRIKWRYCFANYENNEYALQPAEFINLKHLDAARVLLADKVALAQAVIDDPTLAVPEGTTNGSCYSCPFKSICLSDDPDKYINNWYLGYKPYYPKHDDK